MKYFLPPIAMMLVAVGAAWAQDVSPGAPNSWNLIITTGNASVPPSVTVHLYKDECLALKHLFNAAPPASVECYETPSILPPPPSSPETKP